jgi:hypothetical protein
VPIIAKRMKMAFTKKKVHFGVLIFVALFFVAAIFITIKKGNGENKIISATPEVAGENIAAGSEFQFTPGPISMQVLKTKGCVADGLLSGYGKDTDQEVAMINRSNCLYLHRALETWGAPPDFEKAAAIMQKITKPGIIYGMFIAEDISKNADFSYVDDQGKTQKFDFSKMCQDGTDNSWGEHTCRPNFDSKGYRDYLSYITKRAMDLGIQSFLFGQIYYQDGENGKMSKIMDGMRAYAKEKNLDIAIGAQTGNITDQDYLRRFDYIEGGVGIGNSGQIENGPCWSGLPSCWPLLWNDKYALNANNVILALDWSGLKFDDMSSFARMDGGKRADVLKNLYLYFTSRNMGFLMPLMATLNKDNGGCHGPKKGFYSASSVYSCSDEKAINAILK